MGKHIKKQFQKLTDKFSTERATKFTADEMAVVIAYLLKDFVMRVISYEENGITIEAINGQKLTIKIVEIK